MKSTAELEKEMLEQEHQTLLNMRKHWFKQGFMKGTLYSGITTALAIFTFQMGYFVALDIALFMLSGLFFLVGGIFGTSKTSISFNNIINFIFGTQNRQDGKIHAEGVASVVYYIVMATTIMMYAVIMAFLWLPIVLGLL